jgi:hypothetical protein
METGLKTAVERAIYLYGITSVGSSRVLSVAGVDGLAPIEAVRAGKFVCWISVVDRDEYADHLEKNMENLEWLATASVRHQQAVAEITTHGDVLPARFGTVFLSLDSLFEHVNAQQPYLSRTLEAISGCDEWGIKVFAEAQPARNVAASAVSGSEYLKQKAAQFNRPVRQVDEEISALFQDLKEISVDAAPSGKVSSGQPGLQWQCALLVPRKRRNKLERLLERYAASWDGTKRIDCSGPWPAYSFVSVNAG